MLLVLFPFPLQRSLVMICFLEQDRHRSRHGPSLNVWSDLASTSARPGFDLGETENRPVRELGPTWARAGFDLGATWARPGLDLDLGPTWVRQRKKILRLLAKGISLTLQIMSSCSREAGVVHFLERKRKGERQENCEGEGTAGGGRRRVGCGGRGEAVLAAEGRNGQAGGEEDGAFGGWAEERKN